jgi:hypothetical protein
MKNVFKVSGIVAAALAVIFVIGLFGLGWNKFFLPKQENIRREVFEETQSFVHGKIQDLAKYKLEYDKASPESQEALRFIIINRFAEFDETKIKSAGLRNFLIKIRGY